MNSINSNHLTLTLMIIDYSRINISMTTIDYNIFKYILFKYK